MKFNLKILFYCAFWVHFAPHFAHAQIQINEVLAVNSTIAHDPDFGVFSDFLELRNTASIPVNLFGYTLTDDVANKTKWRLPNVEIAPGQCLVVWTDGRDKYPGDTAFVEFKNAVTVLRGLHANFRLSGDGEYLGLFDPQGNLVDEVVFFTQTNDVSYGRSPADPAQWLYFGEPSPGAPNSPYGSAAMATPGTPDFSLPEGFYPNDQTLLLSTREAGAVIRFTIDGTTPNGESPVFEDNLTLSRNLTVKARLYVPGKMPGRVVTKSYFIGENVQLPVLAIASNTSNLYDFDFGILQNAIKDREVPATLEYFEPTTGKRAFTVGVGLRVFGTSIFNLPQRPISVRFKEKFGDETLRYPLFEGKPIPTYTAFLLRNGGNDHNTAFFRDGLAVQLAKGKMDLDYQDYKPCAVFINGEYNGIYELRERLDEQYIASNHDISPDNLDYLEDSLQVVAGDPYDFAAFMDFVRQNDLRDSILFAKAAAQMDINEWTNYLIHRAFIGYQIADLNNLYWRNRDAAGKWRWIAADMEHAFGQLGGDPYTENTIAKLAGLSGHLPEWATLLFNRFLQNPAFRDGFIQRSAAYLNTLYQPAVTLAAVDSLADLLRPQMPRHIGRWHTPPSMQAWQGNVNQIKTFLENRPQHYRRHLTELFGQADSALVSMRIVGKGEVRLSGVAFSNDMDGYFFKNARIQLQAVPAPGFRFVGWGGVVGAQNNAALTPMGDTAFTAIFAPQNISVIPPVIAADTTLSAAASPWYGLQDVRILPGARLNVEAGAALHLAEGVCIHVEGGLYLKGSPDRRIAVRPAQGISMPRPPSPGQAGHWGAIIANTAKDSIVIQYADLQGGSFGHNRNAHFATISLSNTHLRMAHSTISGGKMPLVARGGSVHLAHSEFHTFVRCNGFVSLYNMDAPRIEYCVFKGNRAANTDGIDLKGTNHAIVRYNAVSGFLGSNCDGIDLGIYARNSLVEYNIIHDCSDKGISVGSQSNALIRRNLIYNCDLGVAVKDSLSEVSLDQNTLYGNRHAVACYEKSALRGGGKAFVQNTILAASLASSILADAKSEVQVQYSISDREMLPGVGNLYDDPALVHPSTGNFELLPHSPCINTGAPLSPKDPDGSPADMGAYYTHQGAYGLMVHINEFQYHPPSNYPTGDWVELYNRTEQSIDLKGWSLAHGTQRFVFWENTTIAPYGYLVVCQDTGRFKIFYPQISAYAGNFHVDLDNKSGKIALYDPFGKAVHDIRYADSWPWPPLADGLGASVELSHGAEGNLPADWRESFVRLGTPGEPNSFPPNVSGLFVNEVLASNTQTLPDEQGEFDDWLELYNSTGDSVDIGGLCFSDDDKQPCKWQVPLHLPQKTTIPPHGFLLLWADGQPGQGPLHADFKISAGGESLIVSQRTDEGYTEVDRLDFGAQKPDVSWGRYPDGGAETAFMAPTPGSGNSTSQVGGPSTQLLRLYPNPFASHLYLQAENAAKPYSLNLFNALGQAVLTATDLWQDTPVIHRGNLPAGLYSVLLLDAQGTRHIGKVAIE